MSGRACPVGHIKSFFPVCLLWVTGCSIYGQAVIHGFPLPAQRNSEKEIVCEPVKAPLWHKHKRNGPCLISLNCRLGVRQSSFLRLCSSRHTFVQNPFVRWCARIKPLLRKNLYEIEKKSGRFISKSPVLLLLLHTKSSLKVTQRAEE